MWLIYYFAPYLVPFLKTLWLKYAHKWRFRVNREMNETCTSVRSFLFLILPPSRVPVCSRMHNWGLNTYLYGPKDDLKHRLLWREVYSPEEEGKSVKIIPTICVLIPSDRLHLHQSILWTVTTDRHILTKANFNRKPTTENFKVNFQPWLIQSKAQLLPPVLVISSKLVNSGHNPNNMQEEVMFWYVFILCHGELMSAVGVRCWDMSVPLFSANLSWRIFKLLCPLYASSFLFNSSSQVSSVPLSLRPRREACSLFMPSLLVRTSSSLLLLTWHYSNASWDRYRTDNITWM